MVYWSLCSPSNSTINVQIPRKPTIYSVNVVLSDINRVKAKQ